MPGSTASDRTVRTAGRVLALVCLGLLAGLVCVRLPAQGQGEGAVVLRDDFSQGQLVESKWERTRCNDFKTEAVDVVDGRLRLAASTVGTDDRTVKFHGVRSKEPVVDLSARAEISFELDWNKQANGCYMTAGAYVCPVAAQNPREQRSWVRLLYLGVPPGRNARCQVSAKVAGQEKLLLTEGWPQQRTGREIGLQRIQITLSRESIVVLENGTKILDASDLHLDFDRAYLYLQHSSHSNYRLREVFFDNVLVRNGATAKPHQ